LSRVTILASTADWGGTEEVTLGLLQTLERRGHTTALVDLRHSVYPPGIRAAGLRTEYRHVPLAERLDRLSIDGYVHLLTELATDICVLTKGAFSVRGSHLDRAARSAARRYVIIEHLVAAELRRAPSVLGVSLNINWYRRRRRGRAHLSAADLVVCVSHAVRNRLVAEFGEDWRGTVVHNGVDTDAFRFSSAARASARREWGIPDDAFVFGFMGRLARVKAPDVALAQFAEIRGDAVSSPYLVIAGVGPERAALDAIVNSMGLATHVRFVGWISPATRGATLSGFDAFLLPSRAEGLPLALLEAMSTERASIGCDVGGVLEALSTPSVGWVVRAGDGVAFGRAMRECMRSSDARRAQIGAAARARVEQEFDRARQLDRLTDVVLGER
jgi:glycosyltransferase involved in cell wall biosynthesis